MDHEDEQFDDRTQLNMNQDQPSAIAVNMSRLSIFDVDRAEYDQQIAPILSRDEDEDLASLIPNPSVRKMYLESKAMSRPRVPEWGGYSNIAEYTGHPFLTNGLMQVSVNKIGCIIVTSAGSLVLLRLPSNGQSTQQSEIEVPIVPIDGPAMKEAARRRNRKKKPRSRLAAESSNSSSSTPQRNSSSCTAEDLCQYCRSWDRLVVWNPQTHEVRELPRPECSLLLDSRQPPWDYHGVQAAMAAQTDCSYKIILAFASYVMVYSSTADAWSYFQCQRPTPFGWHGGYTPPGWDGYPISIDLPWVWLAASAMISGRLYCADVVQESHAKYVSRLRVFEVDYEGVDSRNWKLHGSFTLSRRHWKFLPANPDYSIGGEMNGIRFLELVECMGQIYAVIPARIDEHLTTEFTSSRTLEELLCTDIPECDILPVQFHILRLQGDHGDDEDDRDDSFAHRVLRIVVPHMVVDHDSQHYETRQELLPNFVYRGPTFSNWFSCAAEGSVIFVAHEQYLLQYDVVSGVSKTGIIQEPELHPIPHTRYSPNVHMKP